MYVLKEIYHVSLKEVLLYFLLSMFYIISYLSMPVKHFFNLFLYLVARAELESAILALEEPCISNYASASYYIR